MKSDHCRQHLQASDFWALHAAPPTQRTEALHAAVLLLLPVGAPCQHMQCIFIHPTTIPDLKPSPAQPSTPPPLLQ
jgi:hypothetical protein